MSEEELKIDLQDFANKFGGPNGFPRYALPRMKSDSILSDI